MAAVTNVSGVADTTDQASISTASLSVLKDQLSVFFVGCTDLAPNPNAIRITGGGTGFVPVAQAVFRGGLDSLALFVGASLEPSATARTWTITLPATATGIFMSMSRVIGMRRSGLGAIRQVSSIQNNTPSAVPAPTFPVACLANDLVIWLIGNATNPPGRSVTGFSTSLNNTGYATPTTGWQAVAANSGFTGVTPAVTNGVSATEFGAFAVEFDTSDYTSNDGPQFEAGIGV